MRREPIQQIVEVYGYVRKGKDLHRLYKSMRLRKSYLTARYAKRREAHIQLLASEVLAWMRREGAKRPRIYTTTYTVMMGAYHRPYLETSKPKGKRRV